MNVALVVGALLFGSLVLFVVLRAHVRYWRRRLYVPMVYALKERIVTEDGSSIVLYRLPPPEGAAVGPPVLMVHGLSANHRNNDLHPTQSLGRHLRARDRDVWLVTLRSGQPAGSWAERERIRFDRMVEHDVPVAIQEVLRRTGARELDYVGYSMGGMLLYALVGNAEMRRSIRRVVTIGSPPLLRTPRALRLVMRLAAALPIWLVPTVPMRFFVGLVAFVAEAVHTPLHSLLVSDLRAAAPGLLREGSVNGLEDMAGPLAWDFCSWQASDGGHVRYAGTRVLELLSCAEMPALFVAGNLDPLGHPAAVRAAYDAWGCADKRFLPLGREHGTKEHYSHVDMVVCRDAVRDVFEPVTQFLCPL